MCQPIETKRVGVDIDIYDDRYHWVGKADKHKAHQEGLWHRVFTCLLVIPKQRTVLLQKKIPGGYPFNRPDYLDISVGGHYLAGESIEEGVREIREELGLNICYNELISIGIRQTAATIREDYVANEFQHIFLLPLNISLQDIILSGSEVRGLVEVNVDEGIELLLGNRHHLQARGVFLESYGQNRLVELTISREDFVSAYLTLDKLFLRLFIAAQRLINGERKELIFW